MREYVLQTQLEFVDFTQFKHCVTYVISPSLKRII